MIAGDIETNPGPKHRGEINEPCVALYMCLIYKFNILTAKIMMLLYYKTNQWWI